MSLIYKGQTVANVGGGSGGVTMDQVNSAIQDAVADIQPQEVYSTEETRIGTWIDGKPLYRKTYQAKLGTSAISTTPTIPFGNEIVVHNAIAQVKLDSYDGGRNAINATAILPYLSSSTDWASALYFCDNSAHGHARGIYVLYSSIHLSATSPLTVTIEYTKTTD